MKDRKKIPNGCLPFILMARWQRRWRIYGRKKDSRVVDNTFLPLHRLYKRPECNYSKIKLDNSFLKQNFVKIVTTHLDHNLEDAGCFIKSFHQIF